MNEEVFKKIILRNSLENAVLFFLLWIGLFVVLLILKKYLKKITVKLGSFGGMLENLLSSTKIWFLFIVTFYIGTQALILQRRIFLVVEKIVIISLILQILFWANSLINFYVLSYAEKTISKDADKATTMKALGGVFKVILWGVLVLIALDNLGVNISTLIAGLGIGGVAVALAGQKILGDAFASLCIVFDKPFVLGDFIIVGEDMGTIEKIGLKTTRIRSLSGEELIVPNSALLDSRIKNYKRMFERRVVLKFGVTYETSYEKLVKIPSIVEDICKNTENSRFERAHFCTYGDSSLDFEVIYWITNPDYNLFMDVQQKINFEIFKRFHEENICFAYPVRRVFINEKHPVS